MTPLGSPVEPDVNNTYAALVGVDCRQRCCRRCFQQCPNFGDVGDDAERLGTIDHRVDPRARVAHVQRHNRRAGLQNAEHGRDQLRRPIEHHAYARSRRHARGQQAGGDSFGAAVQFGIRPAGVSVDQRGCIRRGRRLLGDELRDVASRQLIGGKIDGPLG